MISKNEPNNGIVIILNYIIQRITILIEVQYLDIQTHSLEHQQPKCYYFQGYRVYSSLESITTDKTK